MATRAHHATATHEGFLRHAGFRWLKRALLLSLGAGVAYAAIDVEPRPNGGTALGYALGTLSALLILWLTALGVRKRYISRSSFSLKAWTSAHVYLGLSLVVLATLHTGFQFGWNVHTLAYALMMLVIVSGIYGIIVYTRLPRALSANRGETTQPQMLSQIRALDDQLHAAAQPLAHTHSELIRRALADSPLGGSLRQRLIGDQRHCATGAALAALREERRAAGGGFDPTLAQLLALVERKAALLAQARRHVRLKTLLEIWLYVHVPASFALLAALVAHIVSVFFYW